MLLNEIITEMVFKTWGKNGKQGAIPLDKYQQGYRLEIEPDIEHSMTSMLTRMGSTRKKIMVTKEEEDMLQQLHIPLSIIPDKVTTVFAFTLDKSSKDAEYFMDAVKGRMPRNKQNERSYMTHANLRLSIQSGVQKLLNHKSYTEQLAGRRKSTIQGIVDFDNMCKEDCVIIPLISSSNLSEKIALILKQEINKNPNYKKTPLALNALSKHSWLGSISNPMGRGFYEPAEPVVLKDHEQAKRNKQAEIDKLTDKIYDLNFLYRKNHIDKKHKKNVIVLRTIEELEANKEVKKKELSKIAPHISDFNVTSITGGYKRAYGGYSVKPEYVNQLKGKNIIFVDDNIVSGTTIADAVKSLYRAGIIPNKVMGMCLHQYK
jgi:hypothetical protein